MGRYDFSTRRTVEESSCINVFSLVRAARAKIRSFFSVTSKHDVSLILGKVLGGNSIEIIRHGMPGQFLRFTSSPAGFGSSIRYWFVCPACCQRAAKLYKPSGEWEFKCRRCHDLTYKAQKEHDKRVDVLVRNPVFLRKLSLLKNKGKSQELVFLKALAQLEHSRIDEYLCKVAPVKKQNELLFCVNMSSFGKK